MLWFFKSIKSDIFWPLFESKQSLQFITLSSDCEIKFTTWYILLWRCRLDITLKSSAATYPAQYKGSIYDFLPFVDSKNPQL